MEDPDRGRAAGDPGALPDRPRGIPALPARSGRRCPVPGPSRNGRASSTASAVSRSRRSRATSTTSRSTTSAWCGLRAAKVAGIVQDVPDVVPAGDAEGDLLLVGWGSTYGAITAALRPGRAKGTASATSTCATSTRCRRQPGRGHEALQEGGGAGDEPGPAPLGAARQVPGGRGRLQQDPGQAVQAVGDRSQDRRGAGSDDRDSPPSTRRRTSRPTRKSAGARAAGTTPILSAVQSVFPDLGIPREKFVVVSGIGCSSRFPYYMNTFGFHTIHGRAPAVATGLEGLAARPRRVDRHRRRRRALHRRQPHHPHAAPQHRRQGAALQQPHLRADQGPVLADLRAGQEGQVHALRLGGPAPSTRSRSRLGAEATFVARSVDVFQAHLKTTLKRAAAHQGTAFIEILQNCNIFNDRRLGNPDRDATCATTTRSLLEHGKPLVFGKNHDHGHPHERDSTWRSSRSATASPRSRPHRARRAPSQPRLRVPALAHGRDARLPDADGRAARGGRARLRAGDERSAQAGDRQAGARARSRSCCRRATSGRSR